VKDALEKPVVDLFPTILNDTPNLLKIMFDLVLANRSCQKNLLTTVANEGTRNLTRADNEVAKNFRS
jgi:hypothetical protein